MKLNGPENIHNIKFLCLEISTSAIFLLLKDFFQLGLIQKNNILIIFLS